MKKCKFRRTVRMVSVWILVTMLLMSVSVMACAAVLDPYELADLVEADGANDKLYITFPEEDFYWRRYHDSNLGGTGYGNPFQYTTQMRYVDNDVVYFHPFGKDNFFPAEGLSNNALFNYNFRFWLTCANQTQEFTALGKLYLYARYKDGSTGSIVADELTATKSVGSSSVSFFFNRVDKAIDLTNVESFNFYFAVDFNGVANENDTASVTVGCDGYFRLIFSLSAYYREIAAAGKTNALIQEVQTQLAEQGKTFDDVLKETQQNGEKLDGIAGDIQANGDKLNEMINGGQAGEDLTDKGDQMSGAGEDLNEGLGDIQDFEDQYMGQLEDNLPDIIAAADFSQLSRPLLWVQFYLNKIVGSIPTTYLVVFTLPMLFGIVMYVLGHPIRAPRPDTSGDIVTRETFTTSTVLAGPKAGRSTTVRTVTQSREIGRVHGE